MHFKNARNASVYAVFRAFFTQSLAKLRIYIHHLYVNIFSENSYKSTKKAAKISPCRVARLYKNDFYFHNLPRTSPYVI